MLKYENVECAFPVIHQTIPSSRLGYTTNNVLFYDKIDFNFYHKFQ